MNGTSENYNIHTHSFYCGHGSGTIGEYVGEALRGGLDVLGFSEHCPLPDGFLSHSRMAFGQMASYEKDVSCEKEKGSLVVLLGYECDYFPRYRDYYASLRKRVDYLVSGTHFIVRADKSRVSPFSDVLTADDIRRYRDQLVEAVGTGLFDLVAHPDLYMAGYSEWDDVAASVARDIIMAAKEANIPLEINANGLTKPKTAGRDAYPFGPFWSLAGALGAEAVVSADAHRVENLLKNRARLISFAREHGVGLLSIRTSGRLEWDRG